MYTKTEKNLKNWTKDKLKQWVEKSPKWRLINY